MGTQHEKKVIIFKKLGGQAKNRNQNEPQLVVFYPQAHRSPVVHLPIFDWWR